jgi:hypothetical protein
MKDGVYVEERRAKMPADWPALEPQSTPAKVIGAYKATFDLGNALFSEDRKKVFRATTFEIESTTPDSLVILARRQGEELAVTVSSDQKAAKIDRRVSVASHDGLERRISFHSLSQILKRTRKRLSPLRLLALRGYKRFGRRGLSQAGSALVILQVIYILLVYTLGAL